MALTTPGVPENLPAMLKRARSDAGFSNAKDLLAAVKASGRKAPSYSSYAQWESGEVRPREKTLAPIIAYHRERKTWPEEPPASDLASTLSALAKELAELRLERTETIGRLEARLAKLEPLEPLVDGLVEQALAAEQKRSAPGASAGSGR